MKRNKHKLMADFIADANAIHKDWWVAMESFGKYIRELTGTDVMQSSLEREFETRLIQLAPHLPTPVSEHRFAPGRRWRFDFAWPDKKLAIELEGGVYTQGRHTRGTGFVADCYKYNTATALGWRVLRFTSDMLADDPASCIELVATCFEGRGE